MQSKKQSFIESLINQVSGFIISVLIYALIFPIFDINVPFITNIWITLCFTAVSVIRSYFIRRYFNYK